jgi:hypothetical protein
MSFASGVLACFSDKSGKGISLHSLKIVRQTRLTPTTFCQIALKSAKDDVDDLRD